MFFQMFLLLYIVSLNFQMNPWSETDKKIPAKEVP